jgi:hypothetical protein
MAALWRCGGGAVSIILGCTGVMSGVEYQSDGSSVGSSVGTGWISQQDKIFRTYDFVLFFTRLQGARSALAKREILPLVLSLTESGKFYQSGCVMYV